MLAAARKPAPAESLGIGIRDLTLWAEAANHAAAPPPPERRGETAARDGRRAARMGKRRKKKLIHFSDDADRSFSTVPAGT